MRETGQDVGRPGWSRAPGSLGGPEATAVYRLVTLLCGLLMILAAIAVALKQPADSRQTIVVTGYALLASGIAEIAIGLAGFITVRSRQEVVLGLLSILTAASLILGSPDSALSLTFLLAMWLLARGIADLLGGAFAARHARRSAMARFLRSLLELVLGSFALIVSLTTAWWPFWPTFTVQTVVLLVAAGLAASGILHAGVALAGRRAPSRHEPVPHPEP